MIFKLFNKVKWSLKTYGLAKAIYWLLFGYFRINRFYLYHIATDKSEPLLTDDDGLLVKFHNADDLESLREDPAFNTYEVFISSYLNTSGCLVGYVNEKPAHIMWIFKQGDSSRLFDLQPHEAELNFCYTPESFRGKGIYARMIIKAVSLLKNQGCTDLYMATHETNEAAQKAITRAGLKQIGTLTNYGAFYRPKWKHNR